MDADKYWLIEDFIGETMTAQNRIIKYHFSKKKNKYLKL